MRHKLVHHNTYVSLYLNIVSRKKEKKIQRVILTGSDIRPISPNIYGIFFLASKWNMYSENASLDFIYLNFLLYMFAWLLCMLYGRRRRFAILTLAYKENIFFINAKLYFASLPLYTLLNTLFVCIVYYNSMHSRNVNGAIGLAASVLSSSFSYMVYMCVYGALFIHSPAQSFIP